MFGAVRFFLNCLVRKLGFGFTIDPGSKLRLLVRHEASRIQAKGKVIGCGVDRSRKIS